jgi:hypothetical protein
MAGPAPTDVDDLVARSREIIERTSERYRAVGRRARARHRQDLFRRFRRAVIAAALVVVGAFIAGLVMPIGSTGLLIAMALLLASLVFLFIPTLPNVRTDTLAETRLADLPLKTEIWLENQRKALPAPAVPILDAIGTRLETLTPQLSRLNEKDPAALEIRKLLSDHLPELVSGYQSIPQPLRAQPKNGRVPDAQLVEGLSVIEQQIGTMTESLASGDLDKLATTNRYLELKYQEAKELGD